MMRLFPHRSVRLTIHLLLVMTILVGHIPLAAVAVAASAHPQPPSSAQRSPQVRPERTRALASVASQPARAYRVPAFVLQESQAVNITETGFVPTIITVVPGTQIVWTNQTTTTQQIEVAAATYSVYLPLIARSSPSTAAMPGVRGGHSAVSAASPVWSSNPIVPQATVTYCLRS